MGKLKKSTTLTLIVALLVLLIVTSKALFFKQDGNISNSSAKLESNTNTDRSFGRSFNNTNPARLGEVADPNYKISLPKDHYSHDSFDIEWWYLTANLQDDEGNDYGLQWTMFRFRNPNLDVKVNPEVDKNDNDLESDWSNEHLYMAHASVHSGSKHWFSEKFARGNLGNAGVEQTPFKLFIDDWQWTSPSADLLPATLSFNAKLISNIVENPENPENSDSPKGAGASDLNVKLNLSNTGTYVLHGQNGYSIKSGNGKHASHYYSAPFINIDGSFNITEALTAPEFNSDSDLNPNPNANDLTKQIAVKGSAWFDQEWTSQLFDQATMGWDWLSLHLDNGDKIMAFRMRLQGQPDYITGTYIESDGLTTTLLPSEIALNAIELTAVGNKKLPLHWQLKIKSKDLDISIKATKKDQWNPASIAYYEGTVAVSGTHKGKGFLELTGY